MHIASTLVRKYFMEENMKKYLLLSIGLFSLPSFSEVSANVGFTTDYIWRGMTQSDGPAD